MGREPAVIIGAITAVAISIVTALTQLSGANLDDPVPAAIVGVVNAVAVLIGALWTRSRVTPVNGGQ